MRSKLFIAVAVMAAVSLSFVSAAGAQYCPVLTITMEDSSVTPGETIDVTGEGCAPNAEVVHTIDGVEVGSATADDEGSWSASVTIPADLAPGTYNLVSTCDVVSECTDDTAEVVVEVLERGTTQPPTTPPGGEQPDQDFAETGTDLALPLQIGVLLVAVGGIILATATRRNRRTT